MTWTKTTAVFAGLALLTACGDGSNNSINSQQDVAPGTLPAMETDPDPTPQTGTGGAGQSRPSGRTNP